MSRKPKDEPRQPVEPPSLYPIDEALITAFSDDPADQEPTANEPAGFLTEDDWMNDQPQPPRDRGSASEASQADGANRATTQPQPATGPQPGAAREHATGNPGTQLADPTAMNSPVHARMQPIAPRDAELLRLAPWQRLYVLALRRLGVEALAGREAKVSRVTVEKYRRIDPEFDLACVHALKDNLDFIEAGTIQSATVGDVAPVFQGGVLVGHKRVKNVKAAELLFKKAGYLEDKPASVTDALKVEAVTDADLAARLRETMERLLRSQQPLLDAETGRPVH